MASWHDYTHDFTSAKGIIGRVSSPSVLHQHRSHRNFSEPPQSVYSAFSLEERLSFYAGNWQRFLYSQEELKRANNELCARLKAARNSDRKLEADALHIVTRDTLTDCLKNRNRHPTLNVVYCEDAMAIFDSGVHIEFAAVLFGDDTSLQTLLPIISKARRKSTSVGVNRFLWPLNVQRHFGPLRGVPDQDCPWENKKDTLVWRGVDTGFDGQREKQLSMLLGSSSSDLDVAFTPYVLNGRNRKYSKPMLTHRELLKFKYLLSLDGNDIASGLKWTLLSNSVVFMPPTEYDTWGMESQLRPFVHYVPLNHNLSDLPDKISWARQHDEECRRISRQATEFISFFVPYAHKPDVDIILKRKLLSIYNSSLSQLSTSLCQESDARAV